MFYQENLQRIILRSELPRHVVKYFDQIYQINFHISFYLIERKSRERDDTPKS